jgi:hypothetical protein
MKTEEGYWQGLLKSYEASGLSQLGFCKEQGISAAKFKYQWRKRNNLTGKSARGIKKEKAGASFESIIIKGEQESGSKPLEKLPVTIRLPNQVSCEFLMDIESGQFSTLLQELVRLC